MNACFRIKYEQTIGDVKRAVEGKLGIPAAAQQLFWHNKELTPVSAAMSDLRSRRRSSHPLCDRS